MSWYSPILEGIGEALLQISHPAAEDGRHAVSKVAKGRRPQVHFAGETPPADAMDPALAAQRTRPPQDTAVGAGGIGAYGGYLNEQERNPSLVGPQKYVTYDDNVRNCDALAVGVRAALMLAGGVHWDVDPPQTATVGRAGLPAKDDRSGSTALKPQPGQEDDSEASGRSAVGTPSRPTLGKPPRAAGDGPLPSKVPTRKLFDPAAAPDQEVDAESDEETDPLDPAEPEVDPIAEEAKAKAEWLENVLFKKLLTPWSLVVRMAAMFKFHGFSYMEWTAVRRDDGTIGLRDIQNRPQATIEKWDLDKSGTLQGVWQRSPLDGTEVFLPRWKAVYVVDAELANGDPQGVGLFRHTANKVLQVKRVEQLEGIGLETDLRGIPVTYAPIAELDALVEAGKLTPAQKAQYLAPLIDFITNHTKTKSSGLNLDSTPYRDIGPNGTPSAVRKWSAELMTGGGTAHEAARKTIDAKNREIARTMFAEGFLLGGDGGSNRALGEEKNRFFTEFVNSMLEDVRAALQRDVVEVLWALNGYDEEMCPTLRFEAVSVTDVAHIADMLDKMGKAGAKLDPRDPVVNTLRVRARLPKVPDELVAEQAMAAKAMQDAEVEATRTGAAATAAGIEQKDKEIELGAANAEADREVKLETAAMKPKVPPGGAGKPRPRK